ncbi:MAG: bifunctional diaminohydroxyphosphoribosylaminopyrimidine deaminase/5-amino-6-(5-phosphoribosylamino)uracil reductase RibD [Clostridia bacterium]|nr:bifunctional diaminohydroxyphosphoribosylaminopyrimidine deaminase/5-amino-6-(5-phosphoribosylamino)uracil reductase RibD [Clostridia bacterium]
MARALRLAERGLGRTHPNPAVGAVVVRDGRLVGEGFHARAGAPHAEVNALRAAGAAARGATVYVTLEPCDHHGRTPPCTEALLAAGVARVVVACLDPNPLVAGRGVARLRRAGVSVDVGVLADRAVELNAGFFTYITRGRPLVIAKFAMTLDGKVAAVDGRSRWITGAEARLEGHRLRDRCDAVAGGVGTALADDPLLTTRLPGGRDPVRVVVDSRGRLPSTAAMLRSGSPAPTWVAVTEWAPEAERRRLREAGAEVLVLPSDADRRVSVPALLKELARRGVTSLLLEGGPTLVASFFEAGVVDRVVGFVAPLVRGGADAPGPVGGRGRPLTGAWRLEDLRCVGRTGRDLRIEARVHWD